MGTRCSEGQVLGVVCGAAVSTLDYVIVLHGSAAAEMAGLRRSGVLATFHAIQVFLGEERIVAGGGRLGPFPVDGSAEGRPGRICLALERIAYVLRDFAPGQC